MYLLKLLALAFLSGSLIKMADDITDRNLKIPHMIAIPLGFAYGSLMGYLMLVDKDAAILLGGIVLGCLAMGKINSSGHYFGLGAILVVVFLYGIQISPLVFLTAALAALDEIGDMFPLKRLQFIFEYRLILKSGILILVIFNIIGVNALMLLLAFDSAYIITERVASRLS